MNKEDHSHAQFFEAYSPRLNVSVVAIRGTDVGRLSDLIEDMKVRCARKKKKEKKGSRHGYGSLLRVLLLKLEKCAGYSSQLCLAIASG